MIRRKSALGVLLISFSFELVLDEHGLYLYYSHCLYYNLIKSSLVFIKSSRQQLRRNISDYVSRYFKSLFK